MSIGTAGTTLSYNGVEFGPYTETTGFSVRPKMDSSGRTVAYNQFEMRFRTVASGSDVGTLVPRWRAALTKSGGSFVMTGRPGGDLYVNTRGVRDVAHGPIPTEVSCQFHGTRSVTIDWSLSFAIPECDAARYSGISEFTYTVTFEVDELGYSKRTLNGRLKVANNRRNPGDRFSADSADDYWEKVQPALLPGFRRSYGPRTLSEDRSELTFSIVDDELLGPAPPPGVVNQDGSVRFSSENGVGVVWNGTLSYSAEVAKGGSIDDAIKGFWQFCQWRFKNMSRIARDVVQGKEKVPMAVFPTSWEIVEPDSFGAKKVEFSVSFLLTTTIDQLLTKAGLWTVTPGHGDWKRWSQSLVTNSFNPRGWAGLTFDQTQDRITDLCDRGPLRIPADKVLDEKELKNKGIADLFPPVDPANSWIMFENTIHIEQDSGVVGTRLLPTEPLTDRTDRDGQVDAGNLPTLPPGLTGGGVVGGGGVGNNQPGRPRNILEPEYLPDGKNLATRTARPQTFIIMKGKAARVKFPCWEPTLTDVNGVPVIPANRADRGEGFRQKVVWNNGRDAVNKAEWRLRFLVDGDLPDLPLPPAPNPTLDNRTR